MLDRSDMNAGSLCWANETYVHVQDAKAKAKQQEMLDLDEGHVQHENQVRKISRHVSSV